MTPFKTITGRWAEHKKLLPPEMQSRDEVMFMLMYSAGFASALEALTFELPDYPENEAMQIISKLHEEAQTIGALAQQSLSRVKPS